MPQARSARLAAAVLSAAICISAPTPAADDPEPLAANAPAELGADEGHFAIVFDSLNKIENARFTGRGSFSVKFALDEVPEGISLFVMRLPAGTYCLDNFRAGKVRYKRQDKNNQFCGSVRAGGLTYTGHYAPRAGMGSTGLLHIQQRPAEFLARMAREQPAILAAHEELSDGSDAAEPRRAANMRAYGYAAFEVPDPALGLRYLERAAAMGSADALMDLGYRHSQGEGLRPDRHKAVEYYERAGAAGNGSGARSACYELLQSPSDEADEKRARVQCERGVELGDGPAHYWLAVMHRDSRGGLSPDPAREFALFSGGAAKGHNWSQYETGIALRDGRGTPRDPVAAQAMLEQALAGNVPDAMLAMGKLLEADPSADPAKVAELYQKAFDARVGGSGAALANLHNRGRGVTRDPERALEILRTAMRWSIEDTSAYAWFMATCPDGRLRDGRAAQQLAEWIVRERRPARAEDQVLLAAAYAENGNFEAAVRAINRAIVDLTKRAKPDDPRVAAWSAQRDGYAKKKTWRESVP